MSASVAESLPLVGGMGLIPDSRLKELQDADPMGREWVAVTEWTRKYTDETEDFYGPVIEVRGDWLAIDIGFVCWSDLGRCTIRRVPGGAANG